MRALETSLFQPHRSRILVCQEPVNEIEVTCDPLKHCFSEFTQVAFWADKSEENEFPVIGEHSKHRFLDIIKVEFGLLNRQKMTFKCHLPLESTLNQLEKKLHFRLVKKQK